MARSLPLHFYGFQTRTLPSSGWVPAGFHANRRCVQDSPQSDGPLHVTASLRVRESGVNQIQGKVFYTRQKSGQGSCAGLTLIREIQRRSPEAEYAVAVGIWRDSTHPAVVSESVA